MTGDLLVVPSWAESAAPPPAYTVSQWADQKRYLPQTSGARGGRWRTESTPYLRGIMNAAREPGVTKIAVKKAAQVGASEALHNILGFFIEHDPCPILMVHPTAGVAEEWSKDRLADMIRTTPALAAVVRDRRQPRGAHEAESTLSLKMFPGGFLALGGANTPNTFARRAVRVAIGDDVDRFPAVIGDEGDPADLLVNRTITFHDALTVFVSTPTMKGGRIDTLYQRSDQRRFFVACPNCGREDYLTWSDPLHFRVAFDDRDPATARLECPSQDDGGCGVQLFEPDRRMMIHAAAAEAPAYGWRPTATPQEIGLAGFHLPAMLSTLGAVSLSSLVAGWLGATAKGKESLRVFINTKLGEGWEDRTVKVEPHALLSRREAYLDAEGRDVEVPGPAVCLTAGVDVQENRFELQVIGWAPASVRYVVDYRVIPGDPKQADTRAALLDALGRRYLHASGHQLPIQATCLDTGYATEEMYDFVLQHQARRIFAAKGFGGRSGEPIVGKPSERRYGRSPRPVRLYPVNTDDAKAEILGALSQPAAAPGAMRFPIDLDTVNEEYFAQLTAEHRETRYNRGGVATHAVWVLDRERNEALDTAVLCLAAFRLLNPNLRQYAETLAATPLPRDEPPGDATPAASAAPPGRRVVRSRYLG